MAPLPTFDKQGAEGVPVHVMLLHERLAEAVTLTESRFQLRIPQDGARIGHHILDGQRQNNRLESRGTRVRRRRRCHWHVALGAEIRGVIGGGRLK